MLSPPASSSGASGTSGAADAVPAPAPARRHPRLRALALAAAVAAIGALPLAHVIEHESEELEALAEAQGALEPLQRTVAVQRGLLAHRDAAAQVLAGRAELEDERRVRQGEVDDRLVALAVALAGGPWEHAVRESDALREDWSLLARRVLARELKAGQSDEQHRLLVEQALQIVDILDAARSRHAAAAPAAVPHFGAVGAAGLAGYDAAVGEARRAIERRRTALHRERRMLVATLALLGAVVLLLAVRRPRRPAGPALPPGTASDRRRDDREGPPSKQQLAGELFDRLREPTGHAPLDDDDAARRGGPVTRV